MRIPAWLLGLMAFGALFAFTGVCAVTSYAFTRDQVVNLWDSGIQVESPAEVLRAFTNPDAAQPTPTPTSGVPVIAMASVTPFPTAALDGATSAPDAAGESTEVVNVQDVSLQATAAPTLDPTENLRWNDPRQVRILLMGIDQRAGLEAERAYRTDTMILVNVDPVRNTAGVISFPRDLWVDIPDTNSKARINTANYVGDLNAYPGGGGPALAMETIRANFGLRVDYFVQVNFTVFETVVDIIAPNGVEVCPPERIFDDRYPDSANGYITVDIPAGCQRLNGETLLQYARTRRTQGSDFDRARRQQDTLDALRRELLSAGGVQNFITQIPALFNELSGSFRTNLTVEEIIGLGLELNEIDDIEYLVIGEQFVTIGQNPEGDDVLFPVFSRINDAVQRVLFPEQGVTQADLRQRALAENAPIYVYNGTDISGLAGRTREYLIGNFQVAVTDVGNTPTNITLTEIRNYSGGEATAEWLAAVLGVPVSRIVPGTDGAVATGVMVVAGTDMPAIIDR